MPRPGADWLDDVATLLRAHYGVVEDPLPGSVLDALRAEGPQVEVLREIGRGGMGVVHEVFDRRLGRHLARKVPRRRGDVVESEALCAEARLIGRLQHPGVVPVHELGLDASGAWFTMPLVRGRTLREVLREDRLEGFGLSRLVEVLIRVGETLGHAHARGVVHLDLKPANVLLGEDGAVYVIDWGVARQLDTADMSPGVAVGTPGYMAPELVLAGRLVDARADLFAVGAVLYEALAGHPPYDRPGERRAAQERLRAVAEGPPEPLLRCAPAAPAELVSIAERAMARDPAERYADAAELVADLRAFVEGRVVRAHAVGPWPELVKWVRRNRALAITLAAGLVSIALLSGLFVGRLRYERDRADRRLAELQELAVVEQVADLRRRAEVELWPAVPARIPELELWLDEAERLRPVLEALRLRRAQATGAAEPVDRWRRRLLDSAVDDLQRFFAPRPADRPPLGAEREDVALRLARSEWLRERQAEPDFVAAWQRAIGEVADDPRFAGLQWTAQDGLLPLGADPDSGLQEFALLGSGTLPIRGADGRLGLAGDFALVLVLVPGGTSRIGADREQGPHLDPGADPANEQPVHEVELAPFFVAKFEVTQAQWRSWTGEEPSNHGASSRFVAAALADRHPVETVSWRDCQKLLPKLGLALPTEVQWEHAARAGSADPWWTGRDAASLGRRHAANLADQTAREALGDRWPIEAGLRDGFVMHAPVGSFAANGFGLCDVAGNVWEWCRDEYRAYTTPARAGDGARPLDDEPAIVIYRGGAFDQLPTEARSANRAGAPPGHRDFAVGLRPVRALDAVHGGARASRRR